MGKNLNKFDIRRPFLIIYSILILLGLLLTIGRWYSQSTDFVIINSEINSHISNLSLSLMAYLGIGFMWLMGGVNFRFIVLLGAIFIVGNILCETVMTVLNTPDIVDAYFGIAGTLISFFYLLMTKKYALVPIKSEQG